MPARLTVAPPPPPRARPEDDIDQAITAWADSSSDLIAAIRRTSPQPRLTSVGTSR